VRKGIEDEIHVTEEAVKTDKIGWFKRTGWLPLLKGPISLVELQSPLAQPQQVKLQLAAELTEKPSEPSVRG
jgi:hypothetical protein